MALVVHNSVDEKKRKIDYWTNRMAEMRRAGLGKDDMDPNELNLMLSELHHAGAYIGPEYQQAFSVSPGGGVRRRTGKMEKRMRKRSAPNPSPRPVATSRVATRAVFFPKKARVLPSPGYPPMPSITSAARSFVPAPFDPKTGIFLGNPGDISGKRNYTQMSNSMAAGPAPRASPTYSIYTNARYGQSGMKERNQGPPRPWIPPPPAANQLVMPPPGMRPQLLQRAALPQQAWQGFPQLGPLPMGAAIPVPVGPYGIVQPAAPGTPLAGGGVVLPLGAAPPVPLGGFSSRIYNMPGNANGPLSQWGPPAPRPVSPAVAAVSAIEGMLPNPPSHPVYDWGSGEISPYSLPSPPSHPVYAPPAMGTAMTIGMLPHAPGHAVQPFAQVNVADFMRVGPMVPVGGSPRLYDMPANPRLPVEIVGEAVSPGGSPQTIDLLDPAANSRIDDALALLDEPIGVAGEGDTPTVVINLRPRTNRTAGRPPPPAGQRPRSSPPVHTTRSGRRYGKK